MKGQLEHNILCKQNLDASSSKKLGEKVDNLAETCKTIYMLMGGRSRNCSGA